MENYFNVTMSNLLKWTLLFVSCMASHVLGELHKPLNVKVESRNFSLFLTWLPAPENPSPVTYEVQYFTEDKDANDKQRWLQVPACENISLTECDFTCVLKIWHRNNSIRVRTAYPYRSSWVEIQNIEYMFKVDPDPPSLTVTQEDGSITIDAFTKRPFCVPQIIFQMSLKYFVVIMRKDNPKEVILKQELDESSITIKTLGYNGEYCVAAKIRYITDTIKESNFSHPNCLNFTQKDGHYPTLLAALLFVVVCGAAVFISVLIWYKIMVKSKKPKVLDFSNTKYCQKDQCLPELYSDIYHSLTIYNMANQDSSTKFLLSNKYDDGVNIYPISGQGYISRPNMQTSGPHSQEYFSSKGLAFNPCSDKSSSGCTCPNTSGSVTDMLFRAKNDQTNDCPIEININDSADVQMFSSTSMSVSNPFDSLSILDPNSLVNVPFDTLCIGDNNDHLDSSDGESGNQCFTDSEDGLDSLCADFTDDKMSNSKNPSQDEKTQKDCSSDYTQRTCMSSKY